MKEKKIHKDKNGREYIKEQYFVKGKMKFQRIYVIDGVPIDEFYERNASDINHLQDGEYWLISYEKDQNEIINDSQDSDDEEDTYSNTIKLVQCDLYSSGANNLERAKGRWDLSRKWFVKGMAGKRTGNLVDL